MDFAPWLGRSADGGSSHLLAPVDGVVCWGMPSDRIRRVATVVVLGAGALATIASNGPVLGPSVSAEEGPFSLVLTPDAPEAEVPFSALLDAQAELVEGSGEVGVQVELDPGSTASLTFGLSSDVTGETNETDIIDPSAQEQARVGIEAFAGCAGDTSCEERFVARFTRLDDPPEGDLDITWYVDGVVEVVVPEGEDTSGSLALTVEQ